MPTEFSAPLRVRYADTDAQGHVYFANYLTYADEGLSAWWRDLGIDSRRLAALGVDFVFADAHARYRERAFFEDLLDVHLELKKLGDTSIVSAWRIVRRADDALLAEGELVQVCLKMPEREKTALPDELRAVFA